MWVHLPFLNQGAADLPRGTGLFVRRVAKSPWCDWGQTVLGVWAAERPLIRARAFAGGTYCDTVAHAG